MEAEIVRLRHQRAADEAELAALEEKLGSEEDSAIPTSDEVDDNNENDQTSE